MAEKYNGFTNYETWAVNLWIMNDEGLYGYWKEETKHAKDINQISDSLNEWLEENNPITNPGLYSDMMTSSIQSVNCQEISALLWEEWRE